MNTAFDTSGNGTTSMPCYSPTNEEAQAEQERLIRYCVESNLKILIAPPIDEVIDGKIMRQSIREIKIEDLLGRPEIKISLDEIRANFREKTVMVTGAAGSIGSEPVPPTGIVRDQKTDPVRQCRNSDAQPAARTRRALPEA